MIAGRVATVEIREPEPMPNTTPVALWIWVYDGSSEDEDDGEDDRMIQVPREEREDTIKYLLKDLKTRHNIEVDTCGIDYNLMTINLTEDDLGRICETRKEEYPYTIVCTHTKLVLARVDDIEWMHVRGLLQWAVPLRYRERQETQNFQYCLRCYLYVENKKMRGNPIVRGFANSFGYSTNVLDYSENLFHPTQDVCVTELTRFLHEQLKKWGINVSLCRIKFFKRLEVYVDIPYVNAYDVLGKLIRYKGQDLVFREILPWWANIRIKELLYYFDSPEFDDDRDELYNRPHVDGDLNSDIESS